jgi:hypothetical protein
MDSLVVLRRNDSQPCNKMEELTAVIYVMVSGGAGDKCSSMED